MKIINSFLSNGIALLCFSLIVFLLFITFNLKNVETPIQVVIADESINKVYSVNLSNKPIITNEGKEGFIKEVISLFFNGNTKLFLSNIETEKKQWNDLKKYIIPESREYIRSVLIDYYENLIDYGTGVVKMTIQDGVYLTGIANIAGEKYYKYEFKVNVLVIGLGSRETKKYTGTIVIKETNQHNYKGLAVSSIQII